VEKIKINGSLEEMLVQLKKLGCEPSVYRRGDLWRAHVNRCGCFWEDNKSPAVALRKAARAWVAKGRPTDGVAACPEDQKHVRGA
jgi:hypothetical protein